MADESKNGTAASNERMNHPPPVVARESYFSPPPSYDTNTHQQHHAEVGEVGELQGSLNAPRPTGPYHYNSFEPILSGAFDAFDMDTCACCTPNPNLQGLEFSSPPPFEAVPTPVYPGAAQGGSWTDEAMAPPSPSTNTNTSPFLTPPSTAATAFADPAVVSFGLGNDYPHHQHEQHHDDAATTATASSIHNNNSNSNNPLPGWIHGTLQLHGKDTPCTGYLNPAWVRGTPTGVFLTWGPRSEGETDVVFASDLLRFSDSEGGGHRLAIPFPCAASGCLRAASEVGGNEGEGEEEQWVFVGDGVVAPEMTLWFPSLLRGFRGSGREHPLRVARGYGVRRLGPCGGGVGSGAAGTAVSGGGDDVGGGGGVSAAATPRILYQGVDAKELERKIQELRVREVQEGEEAQAQAQEQQPQHGKKKRGRRPRHHRRGGRRRGSTATATAVPAVATSTSTAAAAGSGDGGSESSPSVNIPVSINISLLLSVGENGSDARVRSCNTRVTAGRPRRA
ncbi:uncharacterized protein GGS25DRAFT_438078 [Hypoxylon fragiforme]|uniref:uncharacterized protein n=1 Tax=Hypoxylon fragiforme TaxID=63214 RepID=UPI0020C6E910|nr:uncharacterized protein GGS25DRAFT_438078 [Hypoxylon fragiforme]KAI2603859.1 hypothetical protein GGS25DRAFT_438078 [Hypoxylon fragiforme]